MIKIKNISVYIASLIIGITIICQSCIKDDTEEKEAEEAKKITQLKAAYGFTESDAIGDGIYVKFIWKNSSNPTPIDSNRVILSLIGEHVNHQVFEATDSALASASSIYRPDYIYGPCRLRVGLIFPGFRKAIKLVPDSSKAIFLIPSSQAFLDYDPVVYTVELHKIIENDSLYEIQQFIDYTILRGYSVTGVIDSLNSLFINTLEEGTVMDTVEIGDSVTLKLSAFYAETESFLPEKPYGRRFFPINNKPDILKFCYGDRDFPITAALEYCVENMKIGEKIEVISGSGNVYSFYGLIHPYYSYYIVPPYMPVNYLIELLSIEKY